MAVLSGIPLVVHEQNSVAGLANRVLAGVADRVMTGFPSAMKKGEWVGNPVRPEIVALAPPAARYGVRQGPLHVLVVGGSLGAAALNEALPRALALLPEGERPEVVHQSGAQHMESLRQAYELAAAGVASILVPYPHAVDDHQTGNARFLASAGAAILLPQDQLTPERLGEIGRLPRQQLLQMAEKARELARPDATAAVAQACIDIAK